MSRLSRRMIKTFTAVKNFYYARNYQQESMNNVTVKSKADLFNYEGSPFDFPLGSDRYYAQLAVDAHGLEIRDNSINEIIEIGKAIDDEND